jgi:release factor glutamine methyltransferase
LNKTFKYILSRTYQPVVSRYLSKTRTYRYGKLRLQIPKEVFHPGLFFSTKVLLQYLESLPVAGKTFLELGAGSGLISFVTSQRGAHVTAIDINPVAVAYLHKNSESNRVPIRVLESDLFRAVPSERFDIIAINPPYYKKDPESAAEHAWYCGKEGQYFSRLFEQIGPFMHAQSAGLMILSDECDLQMIRKIAADNGYTLDQVLEKKIFSEQLYIFRIVKAANVASLS